MIDAIILCTKAGRDMSHTSDDSAPQCDLQGADMTWQKDKEAARRVATRRRGPIYTAGNVTEANSFNVNVSRHRLSRKGMCYRLNSMAQFEP